MFVVIVFFFVCLFVLFCFFVVVFVFVVVLLSCLFFFFFFFSKFCTYRIRPRYRTVRLGLSKILGKLVKYVPAFTKSTG